METKRKDKGQIFVVGVLLLVVLLALFRQSFFITIPTSPTSDDLIDNIEKELRYTAGISHKQGEDRMSDLSDFFRKNVDSFEGIYLLIVTTDSDFEVFVGNYLKAQLDITLNAVGTGSQGDSIRLNDENVAQLDFGVGDNVILTLTHTKGGEITEDTFSFDTNGQTVAFYDISTKENDRVLRRKGVVNIR